MPDLLSPADAAKVLGVAEADVMAILDSGELKGKKIGTAWRIRRAALDEYLAQVARRGRVRAWPRSRRSRSTPARPAARRRNGIPASRSSCARSAAPSRRTSSTATTGQAVENDLVKALRELPEERARLADGAAQRAVPELQGRDGLRRRRASARTASSAARPRSSPTTRSRRRSGRRACCRSRSRPIASATTCAAGGRASGSRRTRLARSVAHRHGAQPLHSLLDVRREGALPVGGRGRPLLLRQRAGPRFTGPHRHAAGAPRALGAGVRARSITSSTTSRCRGRKGSTSTCCARSSRSRRRSWCRTTRRSSRGTSSSTTRSCCSTPRRRVAEQMHAKLEQLCAAQVPGDTYRNLRIHPVYSNQTFKHVLVPVWLLAYNYGPKKFQVVANGYTGVIAGRLSVQRLEDSLPRGHDPDRGDGIDVRGELSRPSRRDRAAGPE